ncbi:hypothetical protein SAMN04489761_4596 [Tenacibaculum sp. MAR_2009_124]|uniref:hypothetical protein n=1 Tax=Tenacibaculum sp. MAR_2009_124 TaxID=1250059 RepID=UPI00089B4ED5|nr:hypothetical protein [Tenacibaculum sp. MAR_2009_124]SED19985.1 hypothetical protein SAMN04489761_4596 [Tenacibaculum sp. MAR_2009_124]
MRILGLLLILISVGFMAFDFAGGFLGGMFLGAATAGGIVLVIYGKFKLNN